MPTLITLDKLDSLLELRELYMHDWPAHALGYYTLDNFIKWFERDPQLKHVTVYTLAEEWRHSGLYLIQDRFQLFVNALNAEASAASLRTALKLLDWQRGYKITATLEQHEAAVASVVQELSLKCRHVLLNLYRLPRQQALQLEARCPAGFRLGTLTNADAGIVNDLWHSHQPGTLQFIERLIAYNVSVGAYATDSGELVAWCIRCQCGLLGMLHVKEAFRRRGLAELVAVAFTRKIAESGDDVLTIARCQNNASNALFRKLNFELVGRVTHRFAIAAATESELWSEQLEHATGASA